MVYMFLMRVTINNWEILLWQSLSLVFNYVNVCLVQLFGQSQADTACQKYILTSSISTRNLTDPEMEMESSCTDHFGLSVALQ